MQPVVHGQGVFCSEVECRAEHCGARCVGFFAVEAGVVLKVLAYCVELAFERVGVVVAKFGVYGYFMESVELPRFVAGNRLYGVAPRHEAKVEQRCRNGQPVHHFVGGSQVDCHAESAEPRAVVVDVVPVY